MTSRRVILVSCVLLLGQAAHAAPAAPPKPVAATPVAASGDCGGTHASDRCLVGHWEMTVDGALEFARKRFPGATVHIPSHVGNTVSLNADGTFSTGEVHSQATAERNGVHADSNMNGQARGRWSAAGGQVNYCADKAHLEGTTTTTVGGNKTTVPVKVQIPPVASHAYVCSGDVFTQTTHMGKAGDITSTYKRIP